MHLPTVLTIIIASAAADTPGGTLALREQYNACHKDNTYSPYFVRDESGNPWCVCCQSSPRNVYTKFAKWVPDAKAEYGGTIQCCRGEKLPCQTPVDLDIDCMRLSDARTGHNVYKQVVLEYGDSEVRACQLDVRHPQGREYQSLCLHCWCYVLTI
jgi:hypothetical protein